MEGGVVSTRFSRCCDGFEFKLEAEHPGSWKHDSKNNSSKRSFDNPPRVRQNSSLFGNSGQEEDIDQTQ